MFEKLEQQVHEFYNNKYLRNRYPSLGLVPCNGFGNGKATADLAAVALGYAPAAIIGASCIKSEANDYFLMKCLYRGKEMLYLSEDIIAICNREDFDKFREMYDRSYYERDWGELLGEPKHLIDLRKEYRWDTYHYKAEEMALRLCMEMD
jgi:hypothetical protein